MCGCVCFTVFLKQALASFIKEIAHGLLLTGLSWLLRASEAPGPAAASVHALQCLPHAVPEPGSSPLQ